MTDDAQPPATPVMVETTARVPSPLVSTSPATQATAAGASGASSALVVVALWAADQFHVAVPPDVAVAVMVLVGAAVHWMIVKFGEPAP